MQSRTVYKHLPIPFRVPQRVPHLHHQFATTRVHAHQPSSSGSYDSEGDELLKEFQQYADPNKLQKITKRLELTWSVDRRRQPAPCDCCDGSGQKECTWCRGTGAMMVGEELFCSLAHGCKQCPICNSKCTPKNSSCAMYHRAHKLLAVHHCKPVHDNPFGAQPFIDVENITHGDLSQYEQLHKLLQGHVRCGHCKGTGFRAGWMEPGCPA